MTLIIIAKVEFIKNQTLPEINALMAHLVAETRKEEGCITYTLHQGTKNENTFIFYEVWETRALWKKHLKRKHVTDFVSKTTTVVQSFTIDEMKQIA